MPAPSPALLDELVDALTSYDYQAIRRLCAPNLRHWFSVTDQEQCLDDMLTVVQLEASLVESASFDVRRVMTENGAVLMMRIEGRTHSGADFQICACIVATYEGDLVARLDEYADLGRAKKLAREIMGATTHLGDAAGLVVRPNFP